MIKDNGRGSQAVSDNSIGKSFVTKVTKKAEAYKEGLSYQIFL